MLLPSNRHWNYVFKRPFYLSSGQLLQDSGEHCETSGFHDHGPSVMNYTFYLPLPAYCALSLVIGLEAAIGGPEGPQYVVPDISFTAGLEDNEE